MTVKQTRHFLVK